LIFCQLSHLLFTPSTWLNHLVARHHMGVFPLNSVSNDLLHILALSIIFKCPNHSSHFSFHSVSIFWTPNFLSIDFISFSIPILFIYQCFSKISHPCNMMHLTVAIN
jgi:hypothetical protein